LREAYWAHGQRCQAAVVEGRPRPKMDQVPSGQAQLSGLLLDDVNLAQAHLPGVRAFGARLARADFSGAYFPSASFDDASLECASFVQGEGLGASFRGASGRGAQFGGAMLRGAVFSAADLQGAGFPDATVTGARFCGANAREARFDRADLSRADLRGAVLDGAVFAGSTITYARFSPTAVPLLCFEHAKYLDYTLTGLLIAGSTGGREWVAMSVEGAEMLLVYDGAVKPLSWWHASEEHWSSVETHSAYRWGYVQEVISAVEVFSPAGR